ncbi:hypothetical protein BN8_01855 [Fibrisoma limi BUZ 3]|uniref:Uncharacterized protein n=1 Tax=Fibrisoma limi BUZ 3 TaxID=1185876 RepID=I2GFZ7_9BACT|nr:hypothetical protein [Fibrisoma limi]CCH52822.1 hypothetical protein BN8_01855 [Fibrisoma limi BUZ 3]
MNTLELNKDVLIDLTERRADHCLSIYLPTHEYGLEVNERMDKLLLKNHVQDIRLKLQTEGLRSNDIDDLLRPVDALLNDWIFWRYQTQGLAIFRSHDYFTYFHSPIPFRNFHEIGMGFCINPLLPFTQPPRHYYLLLITKNGVTLHKADQYSIIHMGMNLEFPSGLEAVTSYYDFEAELQGRTRARGNSRHAAAIYRSDDEDNKEKDHLLADFFRLINEAVVQQLGTENVPLVLAGVNYYHPIYRQVNTYSRLCQDGLTGNFEHMHPTNLHPMANKLLTGYFSEIRDRRLAEFANASGSNLASKDLRSLLEAAVMGRIEVLFLQRHVQAWGRFDEYTLATTLHDRRQPGDEALFDKVALLTLRHGGEVHILDDVDMVKNGEPIRLAGLYRF